MFDPQNRFPTLVLAAGAGVLLFAIALGQRMGDRVLGQATEHALPAIVQVSPAPSATGFGPDWKRSETLSSAPDPRFPDPRIPPQPLPTPLPRPVVVVPTTPTPNPNIPIWRQKPLPTATPYVTEPPTQEPSPAASPSPA